MKQKKNPQYKNKISNLINYNDNNQCHCQIKITNPHKTNEQSTNKTNKKPIEIKEKFDVSEM